MTETSHDVIKDLLARLEKYGEAGSYGIGPDRLRAALAADHTPRQIAALRAVAQYASEVAASRYIDRRDVPALAELDAADMEAGRCLSGEIILDTPRVIR